MPTEIVDKALIMKLVNEHRKNGYYGSVDTLLPATPLKWNETVAVAALNHCRDMYENSFFSHSGSDGSGPGDRLRRLGFRFPVCGENISIGANTEQQVIAGWMKSKGHRTNIMNPRYKQVGVARKGKYWTMVLSN